ncbi:hypothetical protein [Sporosarcina sp. FA9]|uniref:hypothetical protein n=1 Tax=Sporosarcina sp. FA9 TaxID=3413030 RepID=UPI003F6601CF
MNGEAVVLEPEELVRIVLSDTDEKTLPTLIYEQVDKLKALDVSIQDVLLSAEAAIESANKAENRSAGFGKKKVAIEELQTVGVDLAKAVQSGAKAQKISFEFQTKLAEITKYLFGLGVSNIASNRFVVRELELKLKNASQEEISELARHELMSVIKQLKEQEDILIKLENLSKTSKSHEEKLEIQSHINHFIEGQLDAQTKASQRSNEQLGLQVENNKRFEAQLKAQAVVEQKHSEQLKLHTKMGGNLEKKIQAHEEVHKIHNVKLIDQERIAIDHSGKLKEHEKVTSIHSKRFNNHEEVHKELEEKIVTETVHREERLLHFVENHDQAFVKLNEKNINLHEEIESSMKKIENQQNEIKILNEDIHNLKSTLDMKSSSAMSKANLAIATSAFILAIIHFII